MSKLGDIWVRLGLKKDGFDSGMNAAAKSTKSFGSNVTKYLSGIASKFLGVAAAIKVLGQTAKTIATFERANSTLASVLGTTVDKISNLTESAKQLGRTTEFTATNVTELQTALARLGFNQNQIGAMQESILKFASAVGTDLASAADFTGSALRAFGLQATDTNKLLDIMAASTSKSALDFSKLQTSISIVAPIAKSFGLTADQTASFLGVLANNGFDASSAATALRNILLNLADSNGKLSKGIGHSAKSFDEIIAAFQELQANGVDVNAVLQMTDKRSASAASALIANGKAVKELNEQFTNCNGALEEMYDTMTDNLTGAVRNLKSAWEGLMLSFQESAGPMKSVVDWLTKMVNKLTDFQIQAQTGGKSGKAKAAEKDLLDRFMTIGQEYGKEEMQRQYDNWVRDAEAAYNRAMDAYIAHKTRANKKAMMKAGEDVMNLSDISSQIRNFGSADALPEPPTTTTTTPSFNVPDENQEKEDRKAIEQAKERTLEENALLEKKYNDQLALFKKYGEDTSALKEKFAKDLTDNLTADADKDDLSEQLSTKSEVLKKHYDEILAIMQKYGLDSTALTEKYNVMLVAADAEEQAAIKEEEEAMDELADKMLEDFEIMNDLTLDPVTKQLLQMADATLAAVEYAEEQKEKAKEIFADFRDSCIQGFSDGMQELTDQIFGLKDVNAGAIFAALLEPLADMAIREGEILIAQGVGVEACKAALASLNGAAAIAAGTALVAIGAAAKSGLQALANSGNKTTATSVEDTSSFGYEANTEITVYVEGRIKGSDIVLSGSKTQNAWGR